MIQRKQSIYLFFAAALLCITYFVPLSSFIGEKDSLVLYLYQVKTLVPGFSSPFTPFFILPLLISVTLIVIISIVTIFLYKKIKILQNVFKMMPNVLKIMPNVFKMIWNVSRFM